jgi:PhnB protein
MAVKPIPEGYNSLSVFLAVDDGARAISFYARAFGASERYRMDGPDGRVAHAELEIGDSVLMISESFDESPFKSPRQLGGTTGGAMMYVEDVDAVVKQAVDAGATIAMPVADMFWGDRYGLVLDPFGHAWQIATHIEDVPPEEMERRGQAAIAGFS